MDKAPEWQKGRKSGGSCNRQLLSWRAPIFKIPGDRPVEDEVARCELRRPSDWRSPEQSTSPKVKVVQITKAAGETTGKVYESTLTRPFQ